MKPVELVIVGAGSRGWGYSQYALEFPDRAKVVGVADPREFYRNRMAQAHGIARQNVFSDWRELAERPLLARAAIVATQDQLHTAPAVALLEKGYDLLLEKPMAPTAEECRRIAHSAQKNGSLFAVCHVLRYTRYTRTLRRLIDSGAIGEVVSVDHLEPIGYWHFAHSYTRGNWRNEAISAPMLLAKSCHDLDWLRYIVGSPCKRVGSFGGLYYFRPERRPQDAADRCLDCPREPNCPYSAKRIYLERVARNELGWPTDVLTPDVTAEGVTRALREGPYGRCVWACDNDVADHQVVNLEFDGGQTASFTVTAFTQGRARLTRVFGTAGELRGDSNRIEIFDYLTEKTTVTDVDRDSDGSILSGHGGGDFGLMESFISAAQRNDPGQILTGPAESLESHLMVFAAEIARKEHRIVDMAEMDLSAAQK